MNKQIIGVVVVGAIVCGMFYTSGNERRATEKAKEIHIQSLLDTQPEYVKNCWKNYFTRMENGNDVKPAFPQIWMRECVEKTQKVLNEPNNNLTHKLNELIETLPHSNLK